MFLPFLGSAVACLWRERRHRRDEMLRARERQLHTLLRHARETTPFWRERLAWSDPSRLALEDIRPVTKDEMMSRFEDTIAERAVSLAEVEAFTRNRQNVARPYKNRFMIATTSGTTGRVGYFVTDVRAWAALNGALFARILRHRLIPREILRFCFGRRYRMAMTIATEGPFITRLVSAFRPLLTRAIVDIRAFSVTSALEATIERLNRFSPHYLHSYPTYLEALALAKIDGRLAIEPEFISLGSEPVAPTARATIQRAFPTAEISETYGATECLVMANQCVLGGLHVNEDLCILEPVDRNGRAVAPGTPSEKVYVTNLLNRAQPLIRYELQDSITVLPEPCACGSPVPLIRVEGRSDDTFFFSDATGRYQAHPPIPFEALFLDVAGLAQYQLIHEVQNHVRVRFVPQANADAGAIGHRLGERFREYLERNALGACVQVSVEPVSRLEREPGGAKLRQILSKVPRPAIAA
jgi:phenylacetate-CoA ligase